MKRTDIKKMPTLDEIKELVEPILRKHDIAHASVFGSLATGRAGPASDLDLLIEYAPGTSKSLLDLVRLKQELEAILGRNVDIGFSHTIKPRLKKRILSERIAIL